MTRRSPLPEVPAAPAEPEPEEHRVLPPPDRLTRCVLHVCQAAGNFIEYWGFKSLHGRIWTLLALHAGPLSQIEVAETLGVSRSAVSTATAELVGYGLVRPVGDHRNAPYEAVMDIWPVISDILRSREWMLLESARVALEAAIEEGEIAATGPRPLAWDLDRMRTILSLTEIAQGFLKMLISIRLPRPPEGVGAWIGMASALVQRLRNLR